jgi:hypothetical protein
VEGLHEALLRILAVAGAYEARRGELTRQEDGPAANAEPDEVLLQRFVALVREHDGLFPAATASEAPRDERARAIQDGVAALLATARPVVAAELQAICAEAGVRLAAADADALLDELRPPAVASVGGPLEAAARAAFWIMQRASTSPP